LLGREAGTIMNTVHYCAKKGEERENVEGRLMERRIT
jgi:hypothetical protein